MCCAQNNRRAAAFTLLEVLLAVAILALISFSIYRFVELNLLAIRVSTETSSDDLAMRSLFAVLQSELSNLPPARVGALRGEPHKFNDKESDEMQWIGTAGNGMFTEFADGEYNVSIALRPVPKTSTSELGFRRVIADGSNKDQHWLRLLGNVDALEIRYFDQQVNGWVEKWADLQRRPSLVRIRIWRAGNPDAYEAILPLPLTVMPT